MLLQSDSGAIFTLHSNLGDLIEEMDTKRRSVATAVDNITETTWKDDQSKKFMEHFKKDMTLLMNLHSEMAEKQEAIKAFGIALEKYEKDNVY